MYLSLQEGRAPNPYVGSIIVVLSEKLCKECNIKGLELKLIRVLKSSQIQFWEPILDYLKKKWKLMNF